MSEIAVTHVPHKRNVPFAQEAAGAIALHYAEIELRDAAALQQLARR